jgi:MoaA/NifB/PqqE/SkfB family radical SAM enzyme
MVAFISFQALMQPLDSPPDDLWFKSTELSHLWPDDLNKVDTILDELIEMRRNAEKGPQNKLGSSVVQLKAFRAYFRNPNHFVKEVRCLIFQKPVSINPYGTVQMCREAGEPGNIRKNSLQDIWNEKIGDCVKKISECKKSCPSFINRYCEEKSMEENLLSLP